MQANKNMVGSRLMTVFVMLAIVLPISLWFLLSRPSNWYHWKPSDPTEQALELIHSKYVDHVSIDSLKGLPLDSLVFKLDPHSVYLPPSLVQATEEDLAGHFAGVGIEFGVVNDTITVIRPFPGSPSEKAGLQTGDQLIAIEGRSLTDSNLTLDSIRVIVRGPVGSDANLTIRRDKKNIQFTIRRSEIPTPSIAGQYMLNDSTGYIKLTKFALGSYRETMLALESLQRKGMRALVLDLRGNGGGFMQEAVELADEFLSDDRLIVYTAGAHLKKRSYTCKRPGLFETGKLIVLMNELSASASEVLAGALQDWCRATVVGRRSYGKGLVQEQYTLSNNGALRLTVARYYTPLGRCIQRPYTSNREAYQRDTMLDVTQEHTRIDVPTFFNPCGDTLFAGGGIWPDVFVPKSSTRISPEVEKIMNHSDIVIWSYRYYKAFQHQIDSIPDMTKMILKIPVGSIRSFLFLLLKEKGIKPESFTAEDWSTLGVEVYTLITSFRFGPEEYIRFQNTIDPLMNTVLTRL